MIFLPPMARQVLKYLLGLQKEGHQLICLKSHNLHKGQHRKLLPHFNINSLLFQLHADYNRVWPTSDIKSVNWLFLGSRSIISLCFINIILSVGFSIDSAMFPSRAGLQKEGIERKKAVGNFSERLDYISD